MTARRNPVEVAVGRAVRRANSTAADRPAPVPTRGRPSVLLTVDKPGPGQPAHPAPGTLTVEGRTATLHVGRGLPLERGRVAAVAGQVLGLLVLEIVGETGIATTKARKRIRAAWRLGDILACGRYPEDITVSMRHTLELL